MRFYSKNWSTMADLNKNWLTEKYIDFEYKKYVLLAWLQEVNNNTEWT